MCRCSSPALISVFNLIKQAPCAGWENSLNHHCPSGATFWNSRKHHLPPVKLPSSFKVFRNFSTPSIKDFKSSGTQNSNSTFSRSRVQNNVALSILRPPGCASGFSWLRGGGGGSLQITLRSLTAEPSMVEILKLSQHSDPESSES